jgi:hypothetical protein
VQVANLHAVFLVIAAQPTGYAREKRIVQRAAAETLSSLKGRGCVNRVVDQWFCWLSASG